MSRGELSATGRRSQQVKKLYVGNLPFQATEDDLTKWFAAAGVTPSSVTFIRDRFSGQPRGFGFVEIQNDEEADKAVQTLNGQNFNGRNLVVNEARPPREGGGGGGRGHGGGGGGGGGFARRGGGGGGGRRGGGGSRRPRRGVWAAPTNFRLCWFFSRGRDSPRPSF